MITHQQSMALWHYCDLIPERLEILEQAERGEQPVGQSSLWMFIRELLDDERKLTDQGRKVLERARQILAGTWPYTWSADEELGWMNEVVYRGRTSTIAGRLRKAGLGWIYSIHVKALLMVYRTGCIGQAAFAALFGFEVNKTLAREGLISVEGTLPGDLVRLTDEGRMFVEVTFREALEGEKS